MDGDIQKLPPPLPALEIGGEDEDGDEEGQPPPP